MPRTMPKKKPELIDEKTQKRISLVVVWVAAVILSIIIASSILGIHLRFALADELDPSIEPKELSISITNRQEANAEFTLTNNNFRECRAQCVLELLDYRNHSTIYSENVSLNHKQKIRRMFNLKAPSKGRGQLLYGVQAECRNIKTFFCRTDQKARHRSSLIILNYNLSYEENEIIARKSEIETWLEKIRNMLILSKQNEVLLSRIPDSISEKKILVISHNNTRIGLLSDKERAESVINLWNSEEYLRIKDLIAKTITEEAEVLINQEEILGLIKLRNKNVELLQSLPVNEVINAFDFYSREINENNAKNLQELNLAAAKIYDDFIVINSSRKTFEKILNKKLSEDIAELKLAVLKYESIFQEGSELFKQVKEAANTTNYPEFNCTSLKSVSYKLNKTSDLFSEAEGFIEKNCKSNFSFSLEENYVTKLMSIRKISKLPINLPLLTVNFTSSLKKNPEMCCTFGQCSSCGENKKTPILFIHGHSVNDANNPELVMNSFTKMQKRLENENFINAGELDMSLSPSQVIKGEWGKSNRPVSVRASYYYITSYDLPGITVTAQKSERIENYALRLREIIELLKYRTGSDKVSIVAHSMGGLVAREYILLFGGDDVDKLVTINTPHKGITGRVEKFCPVLGSKKECEDMSNNSIFLKRLNAKPLPDRIKKYSIRSIGCDMEGVAGDGIVTNTSAYWEEADNFVIHGNCTDALQTDLHSKVLDPDTYPETFEIIKSILVD